MENIRTSLIAEAILLHLQQCPASADTLEGICLWWIDSRALGANFHNTLLALEHLEQEQKVERIAFGGGYIWRKPRNFGNNTHH